MASCAPVGNRRWVGFAPMMSGLTTRCRLPTCPTELRKLGHDSIHLFCQEIEMWRQPHPSLSRSGDDPLLSKSTVGRARIDAGFANADNPRPHFGSAASQNLITFICGAS